MSDVIVIDHPKIKGKLLNRFRELIPLGKTIHIKNITSSNVDEIKYMPIRKRLFVTFKSGRRYRYDNVPKKAVESLVDSSSKGKFMWKSIIGKYSTKRIKSMQLPNAVKNIPSTEYSLRLFARNERLGFSRRNPFVDFGRNNPKIISMLYGVSGNSVSILASYPVQLELFNDIPLDAFNKAMSSNNQSSAIADMLDKDNPEDVWFLGDIDMTVDYKSKEYLGKDRMRKQAAKLNQSLFETVKYRSNNMHPDRLKAHKNAQKNSAIRATNMEIAEEAFKNGTWVEFTVGKSENIQKVKYDPETKILTVRFRVEEDPDYQYTTVPLQLAKEFAASPNPGSDFAEFIRGRYPSRRIKN